MQLIPLNQLKEWDKNHNLRRIEKTGHSRLDKNLDLGQHSTLLVYIDELGNNIVVGGNHRAKLMLKKGYNEAKCIILSFGQDNEGYYGILDGEVFKDKSGKIPVHFKTIEQGIIEYSFSHNSRGAYYIEDEVINYVHSMPDIDWSKYDAEFKDPVDLSSLYTDEEVTEDEAPEVSQEPAKSELGKVYQLGRHRLMCGNATKIEDVEKLMNGQKADMVFTDPPYGVSYADKNASLNAVGRGNRIQTPIENDHKTVDEMYQLWLATFSNMNTVSKEGFSYYVCSPQGGELMMMMMMMALKESGIQVKHTIIWVKNNIVIGRSDYHYKHEPILYGWGKGTHQFYGGRNKNSVWNFDKPLKSDLHPTMKPIALVAEAINNSSKDGDIILDLFGGSGSTLIACEQTNRTCYMMELDCRYTDVIRRRWWKFVNNGDETYWEENTPAYNVIK